MVRLHSLMCSGTSPPGQDFAESSRRKSLWATHYRYTNDVSEVVYTHEVIARVDQRCTNCVRPAAWMTSSAG